MKKFKQSFLECVWMAVLLVLASGLVDAQPLTLLPSGELYKPKPSELNEDRVDPYSGTLLVNSRDVFIPGNGGMDLEIRRLYSLDKIMVPHEPTFMVDSPDWQAGVGWRIAIMPRLIFPAAVPMGQVCDWIHHASYRMTVEAPNGSRNVLYSGTTPGTAYSTDGWKAVCGAGLIYLYSPEGVVYEMTLAGQKTEFQTGGINVTFISATKATDLNGNWIDVSYTWMPQASAHAPAQVTTSDGRSLQFTYETVAGSYYPLMTKILSQDGREWRYEYKPLVVPPYWGYSGVYLAKVVLPGGNFYQYEYYETVPSGGVNDAVASFGKIKSIKEPTGGTTYYEYLGLKYHKYVFSWEIVPDDISPNGIEFVARVKKRTTSDGGIWNYSYSISETVGQYDQTTIQSPTETSIYKFIGRSYSISTKPGWHPECHSYDAKLSRIGSLVEKTIGPNYKEQYEWQDVAWTWANQGGGTLGSSLTASEYPNGLGAQPACQIGVLRTALKKKTITLDGASYISEFSNYDAFGNAGTRIESGPNGGARTTTLTYFTDAVKWITGKLKDESYSGSSITRSFDVNGNLLSINRDGVTTSFTYDSQGNITKKTDPRGFFTTYSSYKRGTPQAESQPEGINITRVVDDAGNIISEINGEGRTTTYTYDGLNRVTSIQPPIRNSTSITYSTNSKVATRGNLTETTVYDGFGRPVSISRGGITRTIGYDALGRKSFESNPNSPVGTGYQYDALNRLVKITNPDSTAVNIVYGSEANNGGATRTVTDERGHVSKYTYRGFGNAGDLWLMSISAPETSASATITRNSIGLPSTVVQGGFTRTYTYYPNYYLQSVTNPETGVTTYGRDAAGNMTSRQVGASGITSYTYDGQNRVSSISYAEGGPIVGQTYTKTHQLKTVTTAEASRILDYDANDNLLGNTLNIDGLSLKTAYSYNGNDQLSAMMYPRSNRVVSYSPDILGRPTKVSGYINSVSYWPSSQVHQIGYANGAVTTYNQNSRLWPSTFKTQKANSVFINNDYGYDGAGNLQSISDLTDSSYNRLFEYDKINRLTEMTGSWGVGVTSYDGVGNILSQQFGSNTLTYHYDVSNRLSSVSGIRNTAYTYDSYGNITTGSGTTYSYDGVPHLRCVNCASPTDKIEYIYDGLNERVAVAKAGVKTYEVYGRQHNLLAEYTPSQNGKLTEYIYLDGKRVAQRESFQEDHAGDQAIDRDGDGLTDIQEFALGTDIAQADSDGDGMPDGFEVAHGLNPLNGGDAAGDADGDGLTNLQEYVAGTHPHRTDTDGDGLADNVDPNPTFNIAAFIPILRLLLN